MKTLSLLLLSGLLISSLVVDRSNPTDFQVHDEKKFQFIFNELASPVEGNKLKETAPISPKEQVGNPMHETQFFINESLEKYFLNHQLEEQQQFKQYQAPENKAMKTYLDAAWLSNLFKEKKK